MIGGNSLLAAFALIPAMLGAPPAAAAGLDTLIARICGGGTISIPLDRPNAPATQPCCAKGCKPSRERKRIDRRQ